MREEKRPLVIMPAYNEEDGIAQAVADCQACPLPVDVVVISDGSTDRTAALARAAGAAVVDLPANLGVGGAMRTGYRYAVDHGYTATIQVDADGQHDPSQIPALVAALDHADLVIGARFAGKGDYTVRGPRAWAMAMLRVTLRMITGRSFSDTSSGFRAAGPAATSFFAANYPSEFLGDTVETLVMAARAGFEIDQVPVVMRPRQSGRASKNFIGLVTSMFRLFTALGLAVIRRPYPRSVGRWAGKEQQ